MAIGALPAVSPLSRTGAFAPRVLASVALNYALSMRYVFDHRDDMSRKREFTIFAILSAVGLGLNDIFMFVGVTMLNIAYQAMKVIATFCVTWYNFFSRKKFLAS